jgi:hypothetical protein
MAEVTYFVALPFVAADDALPLASPRNASIQMRAEALSRKEGHVGAVAFSAPVTLLLAISAMPR